MHDDLRFLASRVEVIGSDTFSIMGSRYRVQDVVAGAQWQTHGPDEESAERRRERCAGKPESVLAELLYWNCYVRPRQPSFPSEDVLALLDHQAALAGAVAHGDAWQQGWLAEGMARDGRLVVSLGEVRFGVSPSDVETGPAGFQAGQPCRVRAPREFRHLIPGFHQVIGSAGADAGTRDRAMVRLYWHLTGDAAPRLLTAASELLDQAGVPFRAKVPSSPWAYQRADAGVVYLDKDHFVEAREPLARAYAAVAGGLRSDTPLLTKRLAPGLGLAEDPGNGLSFGQHRCEIIAGALWGVYRDGGGAAFRRRQAIDAAFRRHGLDPDTPFLSKGSSDCYQLELEARAYPRRRRRPSAVLPGKRPDCSEAGPVATDAPMGDSLLAMAIDIGRKLCGQAVWDRAGRRCNWSARANAGDVARRPTGPIVAALGPDLYTGLAGVALFVAELYARTREPSFRRTARAAITCSMEQLARRRSGTSRPGIGLYTGLTGVCVVAHRVASLTGEDVAGGRLLKVTDELASVPVDECADDLLDGRAGAVLALLAMHRQADFPGRLDLAVVLGEQLIRSGVTVWHLPAAHRRLDRDAPLAGLAHGASGVGVALLELYAQTGRSEFLMASRKAFEYEDTLFDSRTGNWRDLRSAAAHARGPSARRSTIAWCHGAPGIALARLRACQLDPDLGDHHLARAWAALRATRKELARLRSSDGVDTSACHGVTGLIETLWTGGLMLGEAAFRTTALGAAGELEHAWRSAGGWRSGVLCGGPNPSLMLGDAGVGYLFLRLHNAQAVPPFLLISPSP